MKMEKKVLMILAELKEETSNLEKILIPITYLIFAAQVVSNAAVILLHNNLIVIFGQVIVLSSSIVMAIFLQKCKRKIEKQKKEMDEYISGIS